MGGKYTFLKQPKKTPKFSNKTLYFCQAIFISGCINLFENK